MLIDNKTYLLQYCKKEADLMTRIKGKVRIQIVKIIQFN